MDTRLPVAETMDGAPLAMAPGTSVRDAARAMQKRGVGSLLVYGEDRLLGILTERDLLAKVVAEGKDPARTDVASVMTADPITVRPTMDVLDALRLMREKGIRHLPVVDDGRVVGLVTERMISREAPELIEIAREWNTITNGHGPPLDELHVPSAVDGICEVCGNEAWLSDEGDRMRCEDCAEEEDREAEEGPGRTTEVLG